MYNLLLGTIRQDYFNQNHSILTLYTWYSVGMLPLCYYPYLHHSARQTRPCQRVSVGDIKQEPGSPSAGEEGGWNEGGGGGAQGDCLYDIVSSQTRFKEDNRTQIRSYWAFIQNQRFRYKYIFLDQFRKYLMIYSNIRLRNETQECPVKTENFQPVDNERS